MFKKFFFVFLCVVLASVSSIHSKQIHFFLSSKTVFRLQSQQQDQANQTLKANQMDFTDSLPTILVNGLLGGATEQQRNLLSEPNLVGAVPVYQDALTQVVQYNLNAVEQLALTINRCAIEPSRRSRQAIENARDAGFVCLQNLLNNLNATQNYQNCIQTMITNARGTIDSLKPDIDNCLQGANTDNTTQQNQ